MKVNDPNLNGLTGGTVGSTDRAGQADGVRRGGGRHDSALDDAPDRVALSHLSTAVRTLSSDSPGHTARLEKLSAEVRSGRYHLDPQAVSRSLVEQSLKPKE
jgi:hypothetical protein